MLRFLHLTLCATLVVPVFLGALYFVHSDFGVDPELYLEECRLGAELDTSLESAHQRIWEQHELVKELAHGRITLLEAAQRFQALSLQAGGFSHEQRHELFPGTTEVEVFSRQVIHFVRGDLAYRPDAGQPVVERLERELEDYLRGDAVAPDEAKP